MTMTMVLGTKTARIAPPVSAASNSSRHQGHCALRRFSYSTYHHTQSVCTGRQRVYDRPGILPTAQALAETASQVGLGILYGILNCGA